MSAIEMQNRLHELQAERALASTGGLSNQAAYLADLDEEIATVSCAYVATAVTEIATLRGELFGRQEG